MIKEDSSLLNGMEYRNIQKLKRGQEQLKAEELVIDKNAKSYISPKKTEIDGYLQWVVESFCDKQKIEFFKISKYEYVIPGLDEGRQMKEKLYNYLHKNIYNHFSNLLKYDINKLHCDNIKFNNITKNKISI